MMIYRNHWSCVVVVSTAFQLYKMSLLLLLEHRHVAWSPLADVLDFLVYNMDVSHKKVFLSIEAFGRILRQPCIFHKCLKRGRLLFWDYQNYRRCKYASVTIIDGSILQHCDWRNTFGWDFHHGKDTVHPYNTPPIKTSGSSIGFWYLLKISLSNSWKSQELKNISR